VTATEQAVLQTLDAFSSVGADELTTVVRDREGTVVTPVYRRSSLADARRLLPKIVAVANEHSCSVTIRPYSQSVTFVQLDDVDQAVLQFFTPLAFIRIRTSPESYQVWLAIPSEGHDADLQFKRRIKRGRIDALDALGVAVSEATKARGTIADKNATESMRCPGSRNWKPKYRAIGFPTIAVRVNLGRITSREELEAFGILADAEPIETPMIDRTTDRVSVAYQQPSPLRYSVRRAPDYDRCLREAPRKSDGNPSRRIADYQWAFFAAQMNWYETEAADWLFCNSARRNEPRWTHNLTAWQTECVNTARNAARRARAAKDNYLRSRGKAA
jgi:hypothetical protein